MPVVLTTRPRRVGEQIADSITHGVGLLLAVAGLSVLVTHAAFKGNAWHVVACSLYGATLVLLYAASTLYHSLSHTKAAGALRVFDHVTIYTLIAGTYTPFLLVNLRGPWGWSLFGVVWGLALAGTVFKIFFTGRFNRLSTLLYLAMGWLIVVAVGPLIHHVDTVGLVFLALGGAFYTLGAIIFYLRDHRPYFHTFWHAFVLLGSASHFFAILFGVIPGAMG